jgi:hypothetical protein
MGERWKFDVDDPDTLAIRTLPDGRLLLVLKPGRLGWGWGQLSLTTPESLRIGTYDDTWYYENIPLALEYGIRWDGTGEPTGWFRHPRSGRRRTDGDPAKEYFQP